MATLIESLETLAADLASKGFRTWVARDAKIPHVRVYWPGGDYHEVTDAGDSWHFRYVGSAGRGKQRLRTEAVERAL